MSDRCRHHKNWVVHLLCWCYECGAIRKLRYITGNAGSHLEAASGWIKPVGKGGENPWEKWRDE